MTERSTFSRRSFLAMSAGAVGAVLLAACEPQMGKKEEAAELAPVQEKVDAKKPSKIEGKVILQITQKQDVSAWIEQNLDQFKDMQPGLQWSIGLRHQASDERFVGDARRRQAVSQKNDHPRRPSRLAPLQDLQAGLESGFQVGIAIGP